MDSFNPGILHRPARPNIFISGMIKIVAKLTQSLSSLLFFCNFLFPKKGQEKGEQDTDEQASYPGKIDCEISPAKNDIARQSSEPGNLRHKQQKNPDNCKDQTKKD
jgi:hypothetical protein